MGAARDAQTHIQTAVAGIPTRSRWRVFRGPQAQLRSIDNFRFHCAAAENCAARAWNIMRSIGPVSCSGTARAHACNAPSRDDKLSTTATLDWRAQVKPAAITASTSVNTRARGDRPGTPRPPSWHRRLVRLNMHSVRNDLATRWLSEIQFRHREPALHLTSGTPAITNASGIMNVLSSESSWQLLRVCRRKTLKDLSELVDQARA